MKKLFLLPALIFVLVGCAPPPPPPPSPVMRSCTVMDGKGRTWNVTAHHRACRRAKRRCHRFHERRYGRPGKCRVVH